MRHSISFILQITLLCFSNHLAAQPKTDPFLKELLFASHQTLLQDVLAHKDSFRVQIIYTQIDRDKRNKPSFRNFYFNVDTNLYFNPASTVKLPLALLALEKLNEMNIKGVNKYTSLQVDSNYHWQTKDIRDTSSQSGFPSIAHYIKKVFLVSENDPYNRLYQFLGQQTINRKLHAKGYTGTRITRQFLGLTYDRNRHTNSMRFIRKDGSTIYAQPPAYNTDSFYFGKIIKIGRGYYDRNDSLIYEPFDFTKVNNLPLEELQQMLQSVMFPHSVPAGQRFNLKKNDYKFLQQYLSQYPSETNYPKYDTSQYYDSYVKDYFNEKNRSMPSYIRVFNKVGWAYGFKIDASYVVDFRNKIEYMLTSVIYTNNDGILNDDKYEYETVGVPFMNQLGQTIYQHELTRQRKYKPKLNEFRIKYEQRDLNDKRPAIKKVDN